VKRPDPPLGHDGPGLDTRTDARSARVPKSGAHVLTERSPWGRCVSSLRVPEAPPGQPPLECDTLGRGRLTGPGLELAEERHRAADQSPGCRRADPGH
jgi:hypothetical protein